MMEKGMLINWKNDNKKPSDDSLLIYSPCKKLFFYYSQSYKPPYILYLWCMFILLGNKTTHEYKQTVSFCQGFFFILICDLNLLHIRWFNSSAVLSSCVDRDGDSRSVSANLQTFEL